MRNGCRHNLFVFCLVLSGFSCVGQRLDITRIVTPRLLLTSEYAAPNTSDSLPYSLFKNQMNATIPVHSKFAVDADITRMRSLKDWNKVVKVNAHQVLWQIGAGHRELQSFGQRNRLFQASTGVMGVSYLRKLKVLFYLGNVGIQESVQTIDAPSWNATAVLGVAKIKKLKHIFLYGIVGTYQYRQPFLIPFLGGVITFSKHVRLTCILPAQAKLTIKPSDGFALDLGVYINGMATGLPGQVNTSEKEVFSFGTLRTAIQLKKHFSQRLSLYLEAGYESWNRQLRSQLGGDVIDRRFAGRHPYAKASVFMTLKESVLKSDVGNFGMD